MSAVEALAVVFDRLGNCIANFIFAMRENIAYVYRVYRARYIRTCGTYVPFERSERMKEIHRRSYETFHLFSLIYYSNLIYFSITLPPSHYPDKAH